MESAFTISAEILDASSIESEVFPDAVGPARRTGGIPRDGSASLEEFEDLLICQLV